VQGFGLCCWILFEGGGGGGGKVLLDDRTPMFCYFFLCGHVEGRKEERQGKRPSLLLLSKKHKLVFGGQSMCVCVCVCV